MMDRHCEELGGVGRLLRSERLCAHREDWFWGTWDRQQLSTLSQDYSSAYHIHTIKVQGTHCVLTKVFYLRGREHRFEPGIDIF